MENRAYEDAAKIRDTELINWPDSEMKYIYEFPENTLSPEQLKNVRQYEEHTKLEIENHIKKEYKQFFDDAELTRIINAAKCGI